MQRFVFSMRCAWDLLLPAAAHGPMGREGGHATHCHCLVLLAPAGGDWTSGLGDFPEDAEGKPGGCASGSVLTLVPLRRQTTVRWTAVPGKHTHRTRMCSSPQG